TRDRRLKILLTSVSQLIELHTVKQKDLRIPIGISPDEILSRRKHDGPPITSNRRTYRARPAKLDKRWIRTQQAKRRTSARIRQIRRRLKDNRPPVITDRRIEIEHVLGRVCNPRDRRKRLHTSRSIQSNGNESKNGDEEKGCETKHREVAPYLNFSAHSTHILNNFKQNLLVVFSMPRKNQCEYS